MMEWDVTIAKMGSIKVEAETQEEAIMKVSQMNDIQVIEWEDEWSAVDVNQVSS